LSRVTKLTASEKVRRDALIVADRARGLTWPTIARRHDLTERQARTVWSEWQAAEPGLGDIDPVAALAEALAQIESVAGDCALLLETTKNDAVRVAAIKARLAAISQRSI
jgi:hypothetical protein